MSEEIQANLDGLIARRRQVATEAITLKSKLDAIDAMIVALIPSDKAVGSVTVTTGKKMKVTVKRGLLYDTKALKAIDPESPEAKDKDIVALFVTKTSQAFDPKAFEALKKSNPRAYQWVAKLVVTKASKASVTIRMP